MTNISACFNMLWLLYYMKPNCPLYTLMFYTIRTQYTPPHQQKAFCNQKNKVGVEFLDKIRKESLRYSCSDVAHGCGGMTFILALNCMLRSPCHIFLQECNMSISHLLLLLCHPSSFSYSISALCFST